MQWAERRKTLPYSTQLWYKWLETKMIFSPSRLNKSLREVTHLSLIATHVLAQNQVMASDPLIQAWIKHALQWEQEQEAEQGNMSELNRPPIEFSKVQKAARRIMDGGEGARQVDLFIRKVFVLGDEVEYIIGDKESVLDRLYRDIQSAKEAFDPQTVAMVMQADNPITKLEWRVTSHTLMLEHVEGAARAGLLDSRVLLQPGDTFERVRDDVIDLDRVRWARWEESVEGMSELDRKRSFRRWNANGLLDREEIKAWRERRRGMVF